MRTLITLLIIVSTYASLPAQTLTHNYIEGRCKLAGKPVVRRVEGNMCAACVENEKKEKRAKAEEDKRIADIKDKKKAEEQRKLAVERQKKENERIAQQGKDAKANTLHLGFGMKDNKPVEKASVKVSGKTNEERLKIVKTRINTKYYDERDFEYSLVDKKNETILTVNNASLYYPQWADDNSNGEYGSTELISEELPNVYLIRELLEVGYDEKMHKLNLVNNKGEKLLKREDIVGLTFCGKGYFLLQIPVELSNKTTTNGWGKAYYYSNFQYILYDYYKKREYPLLYSSNKYIHALLPNFNKKLINMEESTYRKRKIQDIPNNQDVVIAITIEHKNKSQLPYYVYSVQYFDSKDLQWKLLYGAETKDEWDRIHRNN